MWAEQVFLVLLHTCFFFCYCDVKGWSRVIHGGHEKEGKFLPPTFIYVWSHGHGQSEEFGSRSEEAQDRSSGWITAPNQASFTSKGDLEDEAEDDATKLGPGNEVLDPGLGIEAQIICTETHWDVNHSPIKLEVNAEAPLSFLRVGRIFFWWTQIGFLKPKQAGVMGNRWH